VLSVNLHMVLAVAAAAAVAAAGFGGYRHGVKIARAECAEQQKAARDAADAQAEAQRIAGRAADAEFARWRRDQEARSVRASTELRKALSAPISCPAAGSLADVPVSRSVVDQLRDAGSDHAPDPGAAASSPR
jgi:hypothetical protein